MNITQLVVGRGRLDTFDPAPTTQLCCFFMIKVLQCSHSGQFILNKLSDFLLNTMLSATKIKDGKEWSGMTRTNTHSRWQSAQQKAKKAGKPYVQLMSIHVILSQSVSYGQTLGVWNLHFLLLAGLRFWFLPKRDICTRHRM